MEEYSNANNTYGIKQFAAVEFAHKKWSNVSREPNTSNAHSGTVDAIKLFHNKSLNKNFCFTGARDNSLILWDIEKIKEVFLFK